MKQISPKQDIFVTLEVTRYTGIVAEREITLLSSRFLQTYIEESLDLGG
jgi:hypothetical protein